MKRISLICCAALVLGGCASKQNGFARHPELKSSRNSRNQKAPLPPRILPETHYAAGRVFEQQGSPEKAIEQYRKAIAVSHEFTGAYSRLGLMYSITGRHEEAAAAFERAVALKPTSAVLRNNLGFELLYVERWDEAERHLREAARINPRFGHAHVNLGLLLGREGRDEEAVQSFRNTLPEPDAYYNLGLVQRAQTRYLQAAESFKRVLSLNPEFSAARRQLASIEQKLGAAETAPPAVAMTDNPEDLAARLGIAPAAGPAAAEPATDLGALIADLFARPDAAKTPPSAPVEAPVADAKAAETAPLAEPRREEAPKATAMTEPTTQPVQWDSSLDEMAGAPRIADSERMSDAPVANLTTENTTPTVFETDGFMGPPAPSTEEVMLVAAESETRLEEPIEAAPQPSPMRQESWRMMDDIEISLQILRNEVECQKDAGLGLGIRTGPANDQSEAVQASFLPDPAQGTLQWNSQFEELDDVLTRVKNQTTPSHSGRTADVGTSDEAHGTYSHVPAVYTPPATTLRGTRSGNKGRQ